MIISFSFFNILFIIFNLLLLIIIIILKFINAFNRTNLLYYRLFKLYNITLKFKLFLPFLAAIILLVPIFFMLDLMSKEHAYDESQSDSVNYYNNEKPMSQLDTASQRILLAGDSMAEGIELYFRKYCKQNGHTLKVCSWISSTTSSWAHKNKLRSLVKEYNPSYVILVLGSNELLAKDLAGRQKYIEEIISEIPCKNYVWIGPPNWVSDNGFTDLLNSVVGSGKYYSSKEIFLKEPLKSKRGPDKKHPSLEGFKVWTDSVASWIMAKSDSPIRLEKPIE